MPDTYMRSSQLVSITYQESWDTDDAKGVDWTIGARLTLRTLGDIAIGSDNFGGSF